MKKRLLVISIVAILAVTLLSACLVDYMYDWTINGRVVDVETGGALAGLTVTIYGDDVVTDTNGEFVLTGHTMLNEESWSVYLDIIDPTPPTFTNNFIISGRFTVTTNMTFRISTNNTAIALTGRIVSSTNGLGLAGWNLYLEKSDNSLEKMTLTRTNGGFTLYTKDSNATAGNYRLYGQSPDNLRMASTNINISEVPYANETEIVLYDQEM